MIEDTYEYLLAKRLLKPQIAKRSGASYFTHVEQGLRILRQIEASEWAQRAYCLHPLCQDTDYFITNFKELGLCNPYALMLAVEYRWVANNSTRQSLADTAKPIQLSQFNEVNQMLIADKVQNRFAFLNTPAFDVQRDHDWQELNQYFNKWMSALSISDKDYGDLCRILIE